MAACLLAGCAQKDNAELLWARAALERNPQLKVVSVDEAANTIKVRVKITGEVLTLTPGELGAAPIADLVAHVAPPAPPPEPAATAAEPPTEPVAVTEPAPAAPMPTEPATYTVQREDGRVRVSGPGVSIETAPKSTQATPESSTRYDEPIICDGRRFMHFDNRTLTVDGDALIARGGCELHITNSRITATGTALTVLDATVHITNSTLIGNSSSLTTSSAARVFLRNNQFTGLARRSPDAKLQDQGGNIWR
jgi:hypothetical protein